MVENLSTRSAVNPNQAHGPQANQRATPGQSEKRDAQAMARELKLFIDEPPQAKARAQTATIPDGKGGVRMTKGKNGKYRPILIHHTPEKTRLYEARVKRIAQRFMGKRKPFEGAVKLHLLFVMPLPESWPRWKKELAQADELVHTTKPDADNMEKAIKDAFNGVVWVDDCRVFSCNKSKLYERPGRTVGTYCRVEQTDKYCSQITKKPTSNSAQTSLEL